MNLGTVPTNLTSFGTALVAGGVSLGDGMVLRGSALTILSGGVEVEPNAGSVNAVLATYVDPVAGTFAMNYPGVVPQNNNTAGLIVPGVYRAVAPYMARWGLVQHADINDLAVDTDKIAGSAVTTVKIAPNAVTAAKIENVKDTSILTGGTPVAWQSLQPTHIAGTANTFVLTGGTPPVWQQVGVSHVAPSGTANVLTGGTPVAWGQVQPYHVAPSGTQNVLTGGTPVAWGQITPAHIAPNAISQGTLQTLSGSDYVSGSTSYQDVTTTAPLKGTIVTSSTSDIYAICTATMGNSVAGNLSYLAVRLDAGTDLGEIFMDSNGAADIRAMTTFRMFPATAPGTHVVTGRVKVGGGAATVYQAYSRIMVWEMRR